MANEQIKVCLPELIACSSRLSEIESELNEKYDPDGKERRSCISTGNVALKVYSMKIKNLQDEFNELLSQTNSFVNSTRGKYVNADKDSDRVISKAIT